MLLFTSQYLDIVRQSIEKLKVHVENQVRAALAPPSGLYINCLTSETKLLVM